MMKRRTFLAHGCGLATVTAASSLLQLGLARSVAAQGAQDYRALVCILLAGGNDSFNMLVPTDNDQYGEYRSIRSDLALPRDTLLPLPGASANGRSYGLHPGMEGLQQLFAEGDAGLICNVGTLLEPFDAEAISSGAARAPLGLFSHSDQIQQWQTAISDQRSAQGWGGRIADLMQGPNPANGISMNISLSGNNVFQSGASVAEYSVEAQGNGAIGLNGYNDGSEVGELRRQFIDGLLAARPDHILRREYRNRLAGSIDAQQFFVAAMEGAPLLSTPFTGDPLSAALRQIARVISIREQIGAPRQVFFVTAGGWDHHDDLLGNQALMLPTVSRALLSFRDALQELNVADQVTTFTTSDFGRTLTSNGKGSDHGWGGHHIVMGGAVNGGTFYGEYPEIYPGNGLDVGRGIYAPTTAVEEYFAELALWFGVTPGELDIVLPNVRRFYSPESLKSPLGILS
ncbi:DUF1501 domain-containing protein [Pseudohalioglobus lutimaris]|uniref:DUF1501 domain-containing protein n=1 Tax=Pseudohalioglobus lutimaris TaxID=1737061 RepID=A0A2N5X451_9GAMM|nr:DUF1501 domain-containing protein [Pseudohalioglobus lutimaris]PLW69240.1 hypothetical protein C0039_09265 [Pseudohalioglobus lutimaris]